MKKNPGRKERRQASREVTRRDKKRLAINSTVTAMQLKKVVSE